MSDYLSIALALVKILLILAFTGLSIITIIGLFHPLVFNVKLRASQLGQRAEIWGAYLFGMLKIGIVATPVNQDVILKFLFWKMILQKNRRQKAARPGRQPGPPFAQPPAAPPGKDIDSTTDHPDQPEAPPPAQKSEEQAIQPHSAAPAQQTKPVSSTISEPTLPSEPPSASLPTQSPATPAAGVVESAAPQSGQSKPELATAGPVEEPPPVDTAVEIQTTPEKERAAAEPEEITPARPVEPTPVDTRPLKPVSEVHTEKPTGEKPADKEAAAEKPGDGWQSKFRRFRRDFDRRYRQIRGWLRTFMRKWKVLYPVFLRFWRRGKKGLSIDGTALLLRYALHEPYLTGMFHANLAVMSGFVGRFGVNFKPVPVFSQPCIYARGHSTAVIRPWRFAAAIVGLFLEPDLYRQLWQAFKWYRARRQGL